MANVASSTSIGTANTTYTADVSSVTKTGTPVRGDSVTVNSYQDGTKGTSAQVVLKVNSDGKSTASVDSKNVVQLVASGSGTDMYLTVGMTAADPNNWTVNLVTSGGTTYKFVKGTGGGGHGTPIDELDKGSYS